MTNQRLKNIIIYDTWFDMFQNRLNDEQIGKFMKAIGRWKNGENLVDDDPTVNGLLIAIEDDLNKMLVNYNTKVETNRQNGKKGGRPSKTQSVITKPTITQETQMVLEKPTVTQPNPQNLKDKDKDKDINISLSNILDKDNIFESNIVSVDGVVEPPKGSNPPIHQLETNEFDYKELGGYGKFLQTFPINKQRNIEDGMSIWNNLSQQEKAEVMRHSKVYVREMRFKQQDNYIKNTYSYLQGEGWKDMKPKSVVKKPVERGMINMTFINWFSKLYDVSMKEAEDFLYKESPDDVFTELINDYNKTKQQLLN